MLTRQNVLTAGGARLVRVCRRTRATRAATTVSAAQRRSTTDRAGPRVAVTAPAVEHVTIVPRTSQLDRPSTLRASRLLLLTADRRVFMFFVVTQTYDHLQRKHAPV